MISRKYLNAALIALFPLCSMTLASAPAQAQQYSHDARDMRDARHGPVISGFNVDEVRSIEPGVELDFDLYGTPGGIAVLRIDGARRNLRLTETEPGRYEGTYTIGRHDRISAGSAVTANLRVDNHVTTGILAESLQRNYARRDQPGRGDLAAVPRVERFGVEGNEDLTAGSDLTFNVRGTPNAKVEVAIAGSRGVFFLPEVRPGEYSGVYTIRRHDHITPNSAVTATIRANGRYTTAALGEPLLAVARPTQLRSTQQVARYCSNCATVQAVNAVEVSGDGNYLGTVGGALIGGLLGSQVGSGNGRTAAEVAGAVGGAVAGRNIQQNSRHQQRYEVVVRYANGAVQTLPYDNDPGFRTGDKVRVNNGVLARDN